MVAAGSPPATAIGPEWVVCGGSTRSVVDGNVVCPAGIFSLLPSCLECRFLEDGEDDRDLDRSCSVEPTPGNR